MIRASILGRLGADPIERETKSGKPMVTASAAVDVSRPGHEPVAEWINLIAFGAAGEALAQHAKGDLIAAMGIFNKSSFTNREGNERTSWTLAVEAMLSVRTTYDRPLEDSATARPRPRRPNSNGPFAHKKPAPPRRPPGPDLPKDPISDFYRGES